MENTAEQSQPGATGQFPEGKANEHDEGELAIGIGSDNGMVILEFGKSVAWIGMEPPYAEGFAEKIMGKAAEVRREHDTWLIPQQLGHLAGMDLSSVIVAVDFDGTCVMHEFPEIGDDVPFAADVLNTLATAGAKLILWTMRSDAEFDGMGGPTPVEAKEYLRHAKEWFIDRGIPLHGLNENPQQHEWTSSPKCYAHVYIDDAALGCPLRTGIHSRPYVDWVVVLRQLIERFTEA